MDSTTKSPLWLHSTSHSIVIILTGSTAVKGGVLQKGEPPVQVWGDACVGGLRHVRIVMTCGNHGLKAGEIDAPGWNDQASVKKLTIQAFNMLENMRCTGLPFCNHEKVFLLLSQAEGNQGRAQVPCETNVGHHVTKLLVFGGMQSW